MNSFEIKNDKYVVTIAGVSTDAVTMTIVDENTISASLNYGGTTMETTLAKVGDVGAAFVYDIVSGTLTQFDITFELVA